MTHIKGQRDANLHNEDGSHLDTDSKRLAAHLELHKGAPVPGPSFPPPEPAEESQEPMTVDAGTVYVWVGMTEAEAAKLPNSKTAGDMWISIEEAMNAGRKKRGDNDRWLVVADGHTREVKRVAWA